MSSSLLRRLLGAALAGALVLTVVSLSPAQAHVTSSFTHLWKHIQKKADKRYVQKSKAAVSSRTASSHYTGGTISMTSTSITPMSTSITAPTAGFLVVSGQATYTAGAGSVLHCGASLDGGDVWVSDLSEGAIVAAGGSWAVCDITTRFAVTAGTHTVGYATHNDGGPASSFYDGMLTVTFEPYGSAGALGAGRVATHRVGPDPARR